MVIQTPWIGHLVKTYKYEQCVLGPFYYLSDLHSIPPSDYPYPQGVPKSHDQNTCTKHNTCRNAKILNSIMTYRYYSTTMYDIVPYLHIYYKKNPNILYPMHYITKSLSHYPTLSDMYYITHPTKSSTHVNNSYTMSSL